MRFSRVVPCAHSALDCPRVLSYFDEMRRKPAAAPTPDAAPCCPPAAAAVALPASDAEADQVLARLAKALGHPARVSIVRTLLRRDTCVAGELGNALPLAQSTVSQHLKQLKEAGLIRGEVSGPRVCYCVEPGAVALLKALVERL